jgi:hypothetical protein
MEKSLTSFVWGSSQWKQICRGLWTPPFIWGMGSGILSASSKDFFWALFMLSHLPGTQISPEFCDQEGHCTIICVPKLYLLKNCMPAATGNFLRTPTGSRSEIVLGLEICPFQKFPGCLFGEPMAFSFSDL